MSIKFTRKRCLDKVFGIEAETWLVVGRNRSLSFSPRLQGFKAIPFVRDRFALNGLFAPLVCAVEAHRHKVTL